MGRPGPPSGAAPADQIRTGAARAVNQNKRSPARAARDEKQRGEAAAAAAVHVPFAATGLGEKNLFGVRRRQVEELRFPLQSRKRCKKL